MTVDDAQTFFKAVPGIERKLRTLSEVGLGYLHLGQPATTLSGGEAQRLKLSSELSKKSTGRTLYLLDEPTTGLHFADVHRLLQVLTRLRDAGNTLVIIDRIVRIVKRKPHVFRELHYLRYHQHLELLTRQTSMMMKCFHTIHQFCGDSHVSVCT